MRRSRWISSVTGAAVITALVAGLGMGTSDGVSPIKLRAKLDARQVAPKQDFKVPGATGLFTATLTGSKLSWTLTYRGLSGPALAAHIHIAKPGTRALNQ